MSDIAEAITEQMAGTLSISELTGNRIFPDALPQGCDLPAIAVREISSVSQEHLRGASGYAETRIEIRSYSEDRAEANSIRERIRVEFQSYRGPLGEETVECISLAAKYGGYEEGIDGDDRPRYRRSLDFVVSHSESTTTNNT